MSIRPCTICRSSFDSFNRHPDRMFCDDCYEKGCAELNSKEDDKNTRQNQAISDNDLERIDYDDRVKAMVIVTDASVARKTVIETLGFVTGSTVRAKHVGSDIMAGMKSVVGGELKGYTELLANGRDEAIYRLKQDASKLGADAVISMRLTTSMIAAGAVEIMAYGTAVKFAEEV